MGSACNYAAFNLHAVHPTPGIKSIMGWLKKAGGL